MHKGYLTIITTSDIQGDNSVCKRNIQSGIQFSPLLPREAVFQFTKIYKFIDQDNGHLVSRFRTWIVEKDTGCEEKLEVG